MLHLQEHHSKVFDVVIFILFYITSVIFILQKTSYCITNETVNNYFKNTQNLENLKYDLLEHSRVRIWKQNSFAKKKRA